MNDKSLAYAFTLLCLTVFFNTLIAHPAFNQPSPGNNPYTWQSTNGPNGGTINALTISLINPALMYAATNSGVYVSNNDGQSWTYSGLAMNNISGLAMDNNGDVFASISNVIQNGVYELANGTTTWEAINTGLPGVSIITNLASDGQGDILAAVQNQGLYELASGTTTWTALSSANFQAMTRDSQGDLFLGAGQSVYEIVKGSSQLKNFGTIPGDGDAEISSFGFDNQGDIFAGTDEGMYELAQGTSTWVSILNGLPQYALFGDMASDSQGNVFTDASNGSLYELKNGSILWAAVSQNGLPAHATIYNLTFDNQGDLLAATLYSGIYELAAGSASWLPVNNGLANTQINSLIFDDQGDLFAATQYNGVYELAGGSSSWLTANNGLPLNTNIYNNSGIAVNSLGVDSKGDLFAGISNSLYKLIKGTSTWVNVLPKGFVFEGVVNNLISDNKGNMFIGVGGTNSLAPGVYELVNGTNLIELGLGKCIASLAFDSQGDLFAGVQMVDGYNYSVDVYELANGSNQWSAVSNGLPSNIQVNSLVFDSQGDLFAGTSNSVYELVNGTNTWVQPVNNGLSPNSDVTSLTFDSQGDLFAGVAGGSMASDGIYELSHGTSNWIMINSNGLVNTNISNLIVGPSGNLLAGTGYSYFNGYRTVTDGNGVFVGSATV